MSRAALLVGIDNYSHSPLSSCEADALALQNTLSRNADESPNFQCQALLSSRTILSKAELARRIEDLFSRQDADAAIFFFAGHGAFTKAGGFLVTQDANQHDEGVPMAQLITAANMSKARERIIILDCCHSGSIDDLFGSNSNLALAEGVSILAACRKNEYALESNGRGLFTSLVCDALNGGAADIRGFTTVAGLYSYVDEVLTVWDQRPLFKANVSKLVALRRGPASISDDKLRNLVKYFPDPDYKLQLDPSFEPTASPNHPENEAIFGDLQRFRGARLVQPDGEEHLYYAAMNSRTCSLTPLGKFYWRRVKAEKI